MKKIDEVKTEQDSIIRSFENSKGITRRRVDTAQIWVDKSNNIADAVTRKRSWKFGVLTFDFLQTISNDDSIIKGFTGFKQK
jgi:hypothetical protein